MASGTPSPQQAINFLTIIEKLKTTPRTGWVKRGVSQPESIADHMYRMGIMALLVQGTSYDYGRCMKLALVHDIAECIAGDITPVCGVSDAEKFEMEAAALAQLKATLGDCMAAEEMEALWHEYEKGETDEAKLVKDFDKIEMILQAHEYESAQGSALQEFFDSTAGKWRTDLGRSWAEEVCKRRAERQAADNSGAAAVIFVSALAAVVAAQAPPAPCGPAKGDAAVLARYAFELAQNRAAKCQAGGNFIADPQSETLQLTYPSYCTEDKGDGITDVKATYSYIQCEGMPKAGQQTTMDIAFRVKKCAASDSALLQPFKLTTIKVEEMPENFTCPAGATVYEGDYSEDNFLEDWEFAHIAENAFKYTLSQTDAGQDIVKCNSYFGTSIARACVDAATGRYWGYAKLTAECVDDYTEVNEFTVFVDAQLLGATPLDARAACPWPEILKNSPGYDGNFTFTEINDSGVAPAPQMSTPGPVAAPAPAPASGVQAALQCLSDASIEYLDSEDGEKFVSASHVWNKLNDATRPAAVAYPADEAAVQATVRCLAVAGVRGVPRSGGHSYQGLSVQEGAVTIDLGRLNNVTVTADSDTVTVGGGTRLGPMYYNIYSQAPGKTVPAGTCPAVGVGGLITGGGIGFLARTYGLTCDQLVSLRMVKATGDVVVASAEENSDLFWASCGGGGGNFGIVTEYRLKLVDLPDKLVKFEIMVKENGPKFMTHLQEVGGGAPPELALTAYPGGGDSADSVQVIGMFLGPQNGLTDALTAAGVGSEALNAKNLTFSLDPITTMSFQDFVVSEAYLDSVAAPEDLLNVEAFDQGRVFFSYKSLYIKPDNLPTEDAFQALSAWVTKANTAAEDSGDSAAFPNVEVTLLKGGAVAAVSPSATAYPHRDAVFLIQYGMEWSTDEASQRFETLVAELEAELAKYAGPAAPPMYVNYIDDSAQLSSFYGANLGRLEEIKTKFDANNFFKSPMSVAPAEGAQIESVDVASVPGPSSGPGKDAGARVASGVLHLSVTIAIASCIATALFFSA